MELPVQLSSPVGQHTSVLGFLSDTIVKFGETTSHLDEWKLTSDVASFTNGSCSSELLQHGWSGSTTSITVSEEIQCLGYPALDISPYALGMNVQVTSRFLLLVIPLLISSMLPLPSSAWHCVLQGARQAYWAL